jgi:adenosylcobinamide-GDP ribazoletransferase
MTDDPLRERTDTALADLRSALAFLTCFPPVVLGRPADRPFDFRRAARMFPLVGALIGAAGGIVVILSVGLLHLPALLAAGLAIAATVAVTGALHEDGLADTADGLGGGDSAMRKLEIMADSRIGTFGAVAVTLSVVLRVGALAALVPAGSFRAAAALIAAEAASRGAMVRLWHDLPAARPGGMADRAGPPDDRATLAAVLGSAVIVAVAVVPTYGLWAALAGAVAVVATAFGLARLLANQIGGQTGDTLGACQQCAAIAFLAAITPFA